MKKYLSLIKACMTENMSIFKISSKKQSKTSKKMLPIFVFICLFFSVWTYANMFMEPLVKIHLEYVLLTLFVIVTAFLTLIEGIYKSGSLLFNCKDDNLLFSLPIKKSTVLFVRVLKFYAFEVLYNALFLIPAIVVYIRYVQVDMTFYISSIIAILVLPIIPIVISCIIGAFISAVSSKFKLKNFAQIVLTTILLLAIMYLSFNLQVVVNNLAENATSINDLITKLYYPAGAYINLITEFNVSDLLIFIGINLGIFLITILLLGAIYFKINSSVKAVKKVSKNTEYKIKVRKPILALMHKEFKRFTSSPVFIINAGFGLVLFIVICVGINLRIEKVIESLANQEIMITAEQIYLYIPVILFGLICFTSFMTSITSSMISLEGKTFNILKSLPIKPFRIIFSKVLTAAVIMIPCILIGNLILFIKFSFNTAEILLITIASFVLPLISATLGILVNLKYPKMDAENDTEVVKQSMSSMVAVFSGLFISGLSIYGLYECINRGLSINQTLLLGNGIYILIYIILSIYLNKKSVKEFNDINV